VPGEPASSHTAAQGKAGQGEEDGRTTIFPADIERQKLDVTAWLARGHDPLLNPDLLRIFEQILGRHSEHPERLLAEQVPAEYLAQAQRLLTQYQQYRSQLAGLRPADFDGTSSQRLADILAARMAIQQQLFSGPEIAGLFGDDNRYDGFTVERLRITERTDMNDQQKAGLIDERSAALLTQEQREARQTALLPLRITRQNADLTQSAATAEQRLKERTAQFGAEAATRMAQVDRQEAEWQQRIARLAAADPTTQQKMRSTQFTPTEQLRLDAALSLYRSRQKGGALPLQ